MLSEKGFKTLLAASLSLLFTSILYVFPPLTISVLLATTFVSAYLALSHLSLRHAKPSMFRVTRRVNKTVCAPKETVDVLLTITNRTGSSVPLQIEDAVGELKVSAGRTKAEGLLVAGGSITVSYQVSAARRGTYTLGPSRLLIYDDYTMSYKELEAGPVTSIFVTPSTRKSVRLSEAIMQVPHFFNPGSASEAFVGPEDAFRGVRPYGPGDLTRYIDWRKTARDPENELYVREFERTSQVDVVFIIDCSPSMLVGTERPLFEEIIEAVASLTPTILMRGDRVGLRSVGAAEDMALPPMSGSRGLMEIMLALSKLSPGKHYQLSDLGVRLGKNQVAVFLSRFAYSTPREVSESYSALVSSGEVFFLCVRPERGSSAQLEFLEERRVAWVRAENPRLMVVSPDSIEQTIAFIYQLVKRRSKKV